MPESRWRELAAGESVGTAQGAAPLGSALKDLLDHFASPAAWPRGDAAAILDPLLDLLARILDLNFVYARLDAVEEAPPLEFAVPRGRSGDRTRVRKVSRCLAGLLGQDPPPVSFPIKNPAGSGSLRACFLAFPAGDGVLVAAATRNDFPTANESLVLRVAANLGGAALQGTGGLGEVQRAEQLRFREHQAQVQAEALDRIGQVLAAGLDLEKTVQAVTEVAKELSGAAFAAFFFRKG